MSPNGPLLPSAHTLDCLEPLTTLALVRGPTIGVSSPLSCSCSKLGGPDLPGEDLGEVLGGVLLLLPGDLLRLFEVMKGAGLEGGVLDPLPA